jgi:hypothetical protein
MRQPREQAVRCWRCRRPTWNFTGVCDAHPISDTATAPAMSVAGTSSPAGQHGSAAVLANSST